MTALFVGDTESYFAGVKSHLFVAYLHKENSLICFYCTNAYILFLSRLGAGTTRLCAGIVSMAKPISIECQMAKYSISLYQQLEEETGVKTGQTSSYLSILTKKDAPYM